VAWLLGSVDEVLERACRARVLDVELDAVRQEPEVD
jgi:hypothetical protein